MSERIKDDVESMAAQARRLVTDEEGEAKRSRRHFAWQLICWEKSSTRVSGARTNEDQHPPQHILGDTIGLHVRL